KTRLRHTAVPLPAALASSFCGPSLDTASVVKLHLFGIHVHVELDPVRLKPVKRILWLEPPGFHLDTDPAFQMVLLLVSEVLPVPFVLGGLIPEILNVVRAPVTERIEMVHFA